MLGEGWEDQYKRLQRQYGLVKRSGDSNGAYNELLHEEACALDILYHFCLDALNLRDWISKAASKPRSNLPSSAEQDVWGLFNANNRQASSALMACADVANGYKHFEVDSPKNPGGAAEVVSQTQGAPFPWRFPIHFGANIFKIDLGGGVQRDALDLAADAVDDWNRWLMNHGVALPS